jgi:hypothetical protein
MRGESYIVKQLLQKAKDSALLAIEYYNKPAVSFKSEGFIVMMCIAWTSFFHAYFLKKKIKPWYRKKDKGRRPRFDYITEKLPNGREIKDKKWWDLTKCLSEFYKNNQNDPVFKNIQFLSGLRNLIVHRNLPEIDASIFAECQASVLNFNEYLGDYFGYKQKIDVILSFSIQLADPPEELHVRPASYPRKVASSGQQLPNSSEPFPGELHWHLKCLEQLAVSDAYFERRFITQGSAYLFSHGVHGAPRDYAIAAVAIAPFRPDLARTTLETMMLMTRPDGAMFYLHTGRGWCSGAWVHEHPSDLPVFLLWALSEYLDLTNDRAWLDQRLPFYPKHRDADATVRERIRLAFQWLRDRLGVGAHGLLRVGSGDWMDPLALMVRHSRNFHRLGESALNTAFAVHALRRAAPWVQEAEIAEQMEGFAQELAQAMMRQWTGRWFLRGWDGSGNPIGAEHLFADVQAFCLIAGLGSDAERSTLTEEIYRRCVQPFPHGAGILDRPHWSRWGLLPSGWDCNGGVWAAINAFLCWGLATQRTDFANELFHKMSFVARARAYPTIWYGLWSGPDCFNAPYALRPGETFHLPATPMDEFPVMNSNWHAAPLLAWQKLLPGSLREPPQ